MIDIIPRISKQLLDACNSKYFPRYLPLHLFLAQTGQCCFLKLRAGLSIYISLYFPPRKQENYIVPYCKKSGFFFTLFQWCMLSIFPRHSMCCCRSTTRSFWEWCNFSRGPYFPPRKILPYFSYQNLLHVIAKINFQNLKFVKCIEAKENTKTRTNMLNQSVIVGIHTVHAESTVLHQKRWKIRISIF